MRAENAGDSIRPRQRITVLLFGTGPEFDLLIFERWSMLKRSIAIVLVSLLTISGCSVKKVQQVPATATPPSLAAAETIIGITTVKGENISFDEPGGFVEAGVLHGKVKKAAYDLAIDQVQRYWIEKKQISAGRTAALVVGITAGVVIVTAAVLLHEANKTTTPAPSTTGTPTQSCPFVYSWDGTRYVFDAEPYGGAIARGLEKDDYSELGELREDAGLYKLRMTNEVDETQMTNLTELWVVDHPAGTRVVADIKGTLHTVSSPQQLLSARDAEGHDLLPWLRATDHAIWEPPSVPDAAGNLRGDITMTFPKPANATQVKLIANAATGLWGSYMIKKMVELRGRQVGRFYTAVDHSQSARNQLNAWEEREELYKLKVYVEEPSGWVVRGILPGTGPYMSKDRILPLDVSHIKGDTLRIRIHPPAGFWALNSFVADYSKDQPIDVQTLKPATAQDLAGNSVLADLVSADNRYLAMPNIGDTADFTFGAPPRKEGTEREVILHTRGYYKLHVDGTGAPDKKTLNAFEKVPDSAARFAADQYAQWQLAKMQAP
jgi:hypothetical protein